MIEVTKRENFEQIVAILDELGQTELAGVVEHEIELIDKRANAPRKPTATQVENENLKLAIVTELEGKSLTATEIANAMGVSVQRVSQLMRQLVKAGDVNRTEAKGKVKATFTVA